MATCAQAGELDNGGEAPKAAGRTRCIIEIEP